MQYGHPACAENRRKVGVLDPGAYEFGGETGEGQGPDRCRQQASPLQPLHGASFQRDSFAPGSIAAVFGEALAPSAATASAAPLPESLNGVSARVNGVTAPLYFVSPGQVNLQIPYGLDPGEATLELRINNVVKTARIRLSAAAPGIFLHPDGRRAVAHNQDYSVNGPDSLAEPGSIVIVYFTGQGPLTSFLPTGQAARVLPLAEVALPRSATIGGKTAEVLFMGMTPGFVALAQANLVTPLESTSGEQPVVITIGGVPSEPATVWVR
jgi:adhesin/invasin